MLKAASEHLIEQGNIVTLMARNVRELDAIKGKYPEKRGKIVTISQDYRYTARAMEKVRKAAGLFVRIDLALLWVHATGREFSEEVKHFLFSHYRRSVVYQLIGSAEEDPNTLREPVWRESYPERYREIILGYRKDGNTSRWLTHREISQGTLRAIGSDQSRYTIGTTAPWLL